MELKQESAVALLQGLGFKGAKALTVQRLEKKMNGLLEVVDDDTSTENEELDALLKTVVEALSGEDKIKIVKSDTDEVEVEENGEDKPPKEKKERKPREKGKPRAMGATKGRTYFAGQVIRDFGLDGVTDDMIKEVDSRCGKTNEKESAAWLKLARSIISGYLSVKEGVVSE